MKRRALLPERADVSPQSSITSLDPMSVMHRVKTDSDIHTQTGVRIRAAAAEAWSQWQSPQQKLELDKMLADQLFQSGCDGIVCCSNCDLELKTLYLLRLNPDHHRDLHIHRI